MKIVTDSAADMPHEEAKELGIPVAPLFIQFPEGEVNSNEIDADDFYNRLRNDFPKIPTTAQPSAGIFADIYRKLIDLGEEIISVHISSGLSGTVQSARLGAEQVAKNMVHVVDTLTLSGGERFQVLAAARGAAANWSREAILERLSKIQKATEVIYTLDTLTYLARGGRIGRVQAIAGALLNLKPVINVDRVDGKYSTVGKTRTIGKSMELMVDHLVDLYSNKTALWVSVVHGQFAEQADNMAQLLQKRVNIGKLEILRVSPVLGVHTGPGIVGITVVPMHLMDDII